MDKKKTRVSKVDVQRQITKMQKLKAAVSKAMSSTDVDVDLAYTDMLELAGQPPDTQYFLDMFPDMIAAADIMITTVLFPKDFSNMEIKYRLHQDRVPSNILFDVLSRAKGILEDEYNIKDVLQKMAKEELIGSGGGLKIVIPEGVIDQLLFNNNLSMENFTTLLSSNDNGYGILGNMSKHVPKDNLLDMVEISANPDVLRLPDIIKHHQTTESMTDMYSHLHKRSRHFTDDMVLHLSNKYRSRKDVDKPLVIEIHPAACKTIFPPGSPDKPVAYIIMLDDNGYPITEPPKWVSPQERMKAFEESGMKRNTIVTTAKRNVNRAVDGDQKTRDAINNFDKHLSKMLISRMNNGIFTVDEDVDLSIINQTAFARALKNKKTKILVIPASMGTYFAMDYDESGKAINKISRLSILCSIRGMLLFSAMGNAVANNTEQIRVVTTLDPNTSDVDKVMKRVKRSVMNMNEAKLPVGISNPRDFIEWQQRMGTTFVFKDHPDLPKTEVNFEYNTRDRNGDTDTRLLEDIRKQILLAIGPGPDIVDNGFDNNTATETEANKVLFAKRGEQLKQPLLTQGSDFCRKILMAHGEFFKGCEASLLADDAIYELFLSEELDLIEISEGDNNVPSKPSKDSDEFKYFVSQLTQNLINNFSIDIPQQAASANASNMNDELDAFKSWLDTALPAWISEDMLDETTIGNNASDSLRLLVESYKSYFIREWLRDNKMLVDLDKIVKEDTLGQPTLNIATKITDHNHQLSDNIKEIYKRFKETAAELDNELEPETPEGNDGGSSDTVDY